MNRSASFLSGCLIGLVALSGLNAQEVITPLAGNPIAEQFHRTRKGVKKSSVSVTLELPVFDDFSTTMVAPDPNTWSDAGAFVNNNYCINPVTNVVATLDAIDFDGSIYPGATFDPTSFVADHLTSHNVQLTYTVGDSIYFSFQIGRASCRERV